MAQYAWADGAEAIENDEGKITIQTCRKLHDVLVFPVLICVLCKESGGTSAHHFASAWLKKWEEVIHAMLDARVGRWGLLCTKTFQQTYQKIDVFCLCCLLAC